jgi:hypothetical protein
VSQHAISFVIAMAPMAFMRRLTVRVQLDRVEQNALAEALHAAVLKRAAPISHSAQKIRRVVALPSFGGLLHTYFRVMCDKDKGIAFCKMAI